MAPSIQDIEDQKRREMRWVEQGAERFRAHCDRAVQNGAGIMTTAGRVLMKQVHARFMARLEAYEAEVSPQVQLAAKDPLIQVLAILKVEHVSAVVITAALKVVLRVSGSVTKDRAIGRAKAIGEAIEHDIRFNVWKEEADEAGKRAIEHMKKRMEADPRSWRRRLVQLRTLATEAWDDELCVVVGLDLLALLCEACPDVFVAKLVGLPPNQVRTVAFTDEAAALVSNVETTAALACPRVGAMVVPPRPWSYA